MGLFDVCARDLNSCTYETNILNTEPSLHPGYPFLYCKDMIITEAI